MKKKNFINIAFIYQPHFKTNCFRVATSSQKASKINYIIVTCSPGYKGLWSWDKTKVTPTRWMNGENPCYCVPITSCTFVKPLEEMQRKDLVKEIKKQQKKWFDNQVRNRDYIYKDKPDWML